MDAVILVGGFGSRLRPFTETVPKPLLPVLNVPIIDRIIGQLPRDLRRVVLALGYRWQQLEDHFAERARREKGGPEVVLVTEDKPLGTGGALKHVEKHLDGRFLMLNGDVISSLDIPAMVKQHGRAGGAGTLALWEVDDPSAFGVVALDRKKRITQFKEKPRREEAPSKLISAGVYVLEHDVLDLLKPGKQASIEREIFPQLIPRGLNGFPFSGYWVDAGRPEDYLQAHWLLLPKSDVSPRAAVDPAATITDPVLVPDTAVIRRGAKVGPRVSLGQRCDLGENCAVTGSVLFDGVHVGKKASVSRSILGASVRIGDGARVEGCLLGDLTDVPAKERHRGETIWDGSSPAPRT